MPSENQSMFTASHVCQLPCNESGDEISVSDIEIEVIISDTCHCLSCQKMDKINPPTHPLVRMFDSIFINKCCKMLDMA